MEVPLSVLIPTRDRPRKVRRCVDSVLAQKGVDYEVIVFDDASVRELQGEILSENYSKRLRILRTEDPVGAARARNILAEEAEGRVFLYLDDDAFLNQSGVLYRVLRAFDHHPRMGISAFRILDNIKGGNRLRVPFSCTQQKRTPRITEQEQLVSVFIGCGYAIRADVFRQTGGYEGFFRYMGEEQDLSFKTLEAGYTIWYIPDIRIEHDPERPTVARSTERSRLFYNVRNRAYLARRYIPSCYLATYLPYWLLLYLGRAIAYSDLKGFIRGVRAGWRQWESWPRAPLSLRTQNYLRRHGGRLWF